MFTVIGCARRQDLGFDSTTSGSGGATASASSSEAAASSSSSAGAGGADAGPSGPTELTVVDGINDYDAVRFCFLPGDAPWPAAATGLPFAQGQAVDLATEIPAGADVVPWVIAGDLTQTAGKTCAQILALAAPGDGGAAPIVASALGVIPQSVLASGKSLLLVASGCLGGPGHDDPNAKLGCGQAYSAASPDPGAVLGAMSRITSPGRVGLQVAHASASLPTSDVRVLPSKMMATDSLIAPSLPFGGIGPVPPFAGLPLGDYGALDGVMIETALPGSSSPTSSTPLGEVFAKSAVSEAAFVDGAGLVLVAVGGYPGQPAGPFWHKLTFALVKADPGAK